MTQNKCSCKEASCIEDCKRQHTHKTFSCEHCEPQEKTTGCKACECLSSGRNADICKYPGDCVHTHCVCNFQCKAHTEGEPIAKHYKGGVNPIYCVTCQCQNVHAPTLPAPEPVEDWEKDEFSVAVNDYGNKVLEIGIEFIRSKKTEEQRNIDWKIGAYKLIDLHKKLLAEKERVPMGIDQWIEHGKKYGYLDYVIATHHDE